MYQSTKIDHVFLWRDNSIIFSATIHTSLLLNFYNKFPKLFETFKIFLKTFIKAILIKVCFQSIKKSLDHQTVGWSDDRPIDPSYCIEDCRISKCIALKLSIFFYKPNETIYSSFRASYTSSCLSPCWMDHRSTARS